MLSFNRRGVMIWQYIIPPSLYSTPSGPNASESFYFDSQGSIYLILMSSENLMRKEFELIAVETKTC